MIQRSQVTMSNQQDNTPGEFYSWIILGVSFLIMVVYGGVQFSFGVFFKPLISEFGWTRSATSGIYSLYMIMRGVFALVLGSLSDRYGARLSLTIGSIAMGLGLLLTSRATAIWQLYLLYSVLVGVGAGAFSTTLPTAISRWFVRRRGLALGIWSSGLGIGTLIFSPLSQFLISAYDWRSSYIILAIIAGTITIPGALMIRDRANDTRPSRDSQKTDQGGKATPWDYAETQIPFRQVIRISSFWMLITVAVIGMFITFAPILHLVAYATDQGISAVTAANILAIVGVFSFIGRIVIGTASDRIEARKLIAIMYFLQGAVLLLLALQLRDVATLYMLGAVFGFCWGGTVPLVTSLTAQYFGVYSMGATYGTLQLSGLTGSALASVMAGYIHDTTGTYVIAFAIFGVLGILGSILTLLLPRSKAANPTPRNPSLTL
ncbi:MFS transporter [Chloroflexota bacterium]